MNRIIIFWRAVGGTAGVEFALLLPLLAVLLFGGVEIGRLLRDYHVVSESVRDAGRYVSRDRAECTTGGVGSIEAVDEDIAKNLALTGGVAAGLPYLLGSWTDRSTVTIDIKCIDNGSGALQGLYAGDAYVPHVVVTAIVPFTFLFGQLVTSSGTINLTLSHNVIVNVGFL